MATTKRTNQPIGVHRAPWPGMLRKQTTVGGRDVTTYELAAIEDGRMTLSSELSYPEMMGMLIRGLPVRDMLPAFEKLVHHANPNQNNRVAFIVSDPGFGKSFLAVLLGKARDRRGPVITEVGGKNLETLLFRTVFDSEKSKTLTQAIDKGLEEGTLDPLSINALKASFGKHYSEDQFRKSVDWKGLKDDTKMKLEDIKQALETVRTVQGWDSKGLGIGFKVEKGPLVLAHEQGRDIVIDELDKCVEGSEGPLQLVMQVLKGELPEHTVQLGSLGSFTFRRGGPGLVMFTGNKPGDGKASHAMSDSFTRRVPRFEISGFSAESWMDMTAKMLTGLPIPILHQISPGQWQKEKNKSSSETRWVLDDSEAFTRKLFEFTTLGMDDEDRRKLKEWQLSEVSNWENVLVASRKLGDFYHKWAQLVNPQSDIYASGKFADIREEVENIDNPTDKVTPSNMMSHIEEALIDGPKKKEASKSSGFSSNFNWNDPFQSPPSKDPVEENIGGRLVDAIMNEVYRTSAQAGKNHLYAQLMQDAKEAGLVGEPPPIAQLLNVDPTKVKGSLGQVKQEQNTHATLLRTLFPNLELSANDEDVLPIRYVQSAIEQMERERKPAEITAFTTAIDVPNTDVGTVQQRLFDRVAVDNKDPSESLAEARKRLPAGKLLDRLTLLSSLAMHSVGEQNLEALWNKALTKGGFAPDEATKMAQSQSKTGIAVTSVCCGKGEGKGAEYVTLHVIRNKTKGQTVIVGNDSIPDDLYNRLKRRNILYLNQEHFSTRDRLASELKDMAGPKNMDDVKAAFLLRNEAKKDQELPDLLAKSDATKLTEPNFVTTLNPENVKHSTKVADAKLRNRLLKSMLGD